jgi:hypothetical protein
MTESHAPTSGNQRTYRDVLADAVRVLTEAARRTINWRDHDGREYQLQADFAEFVTRALAGAAANMGSIEAVLAGRPGSWEANYVRRMLHSTVGYEEQYLHEHRTERLIVRVHVEDILNDLGLSTLYDDAHEEISRREDAIRARHSSYDEGQAALDKLDRLHEALDAWRARECAAYGHAFRANIEVAADELFPDLPVPVEVIVELDWQDDLGPTYEWDGPAWRLWETARRNTALPGSGLPLKDYPLGADIAEVERDAGRDPLTRLESGEARG